MVNSRKSAANKKQLRRIEWAIVKRLVEVLHDSNGIKKTSLAMKSALSYDKCVLYLNWMKMMGLINREIDEGGFELVSLSDEGKELFERSFKNNGMYIAN